MEGLTLLQEAQAAGLRVRRDGDQLVVRGPRSAEPIAKQLVARKTEVFACLEKSPSVLLHSELLKWAGDSLERWSQIRAALLRIYLPSWDRVDARDLLVAWTGAQCAIVIAQRELRRLEDMGRPLTRGERAAKGGREADVSFYGRLSRRLQEHVPAALAGDPEAARTLAKIIRIDRA